MSAAAVGPAVSLCGRQSALSCFPAAATTSTATSCLPGNAVPLDFRLECASCRRVEHFLKSRLDGFGSQPKWCSARGSVQVRASAANVEQAELAETPVSVTVEAEVNEAAKEQPEIETVEKVDEKTDGAVEEAGVKEEGPETVAQEAETKEESVVGQTEGSEEEQGEDARPRLKVPTEAKLKRRSADWKKAETLRTAGSIHEGKVEACNSGGLIVRYMSLLGFLPLSQIDWTRVPADGSKSIVDVAKEMVGQDVKVKITESNEESKRLLFSEKEANHALKLREIIEGDVFEGVVNGVTDYGAFVNLKSSEGVAGTSQVSGLVHVSELSWDMVRDPKDVIQVGQEVKVKVVNVDRSKGRLALSIKQLQADPLFETLDTLMPVESQGEAPSSDESSSELPETPLPGLEPICEELLKEDGISAVTLGRQANEKRVVSQDLELWVSNEPVEDGSFTLLARAGRLVQEVHVTTSLDKEGIKAAVQRVTGRVE